MSKSTARIKTAAIPAPRTREEAENLLGEIGSLQRQITDIETAMNHQLAAIKQNFEQQSAPLNDQIEGKFKALHAWAEANRDHLLDGRSKTAKLASGEISWRARPPTVSVRGADIVLATLKRMGLTDLIRTREELNKEAVLAEPARVEGIKGISIVRDTEDFVAKPYESQIERAETVARQAA